MVTGLGVKWLVKGAWSRKIQILHSHDAAKVQMVRLTLTVAAGKKETTFGFSRYTFFGYLFAKKMWFSEPPDKPSICPEDLQVFP